VLFSKSRTPAYLEEYKYQLRSNEWKLPWDDALHVLFNAPDDQPDYAARSIACALDLDAFGQAFRDPGYGKGMGGDHTRGRGKHLCDLGRRRQSSRHDH